MTTWGYVYLAIVSIVMIYLIYRYADLSMRVRRQRRRYDLLLRGRGELNIEELLKAHSHDIELAVRKLKSMEDSNALLEQKMEENRAYLDSKIGEFNDSTNSDLSSKINNQFENLDGKIVGNFEKTNSDLSRLNYELSNMVKELDSKMTNNINSVDDKHSKRSNNLDAKFTNEVEKINSDISNNFKKLSEKHEIDFSDLSKLINDKNDTILDYVNKKDKSLDENISLAIQQVSLHKYNAFNNQSGDLSFTLVLLDRMYNGVMLTSINARDASYTYTKEIKNGKCAVNISPDEEEALNILVKKN